MLDITLAKQTYWTYTDCCTTDKLKAPSVNCTLASRQYQIHLPIHSIDSVYHIYATNCRIQKTIYCTRNAQQRWNPGFVYWTLKMRSLKSLTGLFTDLSQAPHGGLLCVVRLAGVAGRWSDALISNSVEVGRLQNLIRAVAPQVLSHTNVKLLSKGLAERSDNEWNHCNLHAT